MDDITVIFFDLGDTLGTAILEHGALSAFSPFNFAIPVLAELRGKGLRLGVISNTGNESRGRMDEVLNAAGLLTFFDPSLLIFSSEVGKTKNSPDIFTLAADRAGVKPKRTLFVGENPEERNYARAAGMEVCPHPLLVAAKLAGHALRYVRVDPSAGPPETWLAALRAKNGSVPASEVLILPLHRLLTTPGSLFAVASQRALVTWDPVTLGAVKTLGPENPSEETDLYLVESPLPPEADPRRQRVLDIVGERLVVAVPGEDVLETFHSVPERHGEKERLMAKPSLLDPPTPQDLRTAFFAVSTTAAESTVTAEQFLAWNNLSPARVMRRVRRYSGQMALNDGQPLLIKSRNTAHPGNLRTVEALESEFASLGGNRLRIRRHAFTHQGRTLFNVVAELPGDSEELVIISAHLDTTAASSPPYHPESDPAPGADDDASGMAAVLSIAEIILTLTALIPAKRTAQFVLFNDEENGLVGSQAYARLMRDSGATITGVFQMDMIGYSSQEPRDWEVHVGVENSPAVEESSRALGEAIAAASERVAPSLPAPQLYDSSTGDPAAGRSDHGPFNALGYAACVVSEDFFGGPPGTANAPEANPHYHRKTDLIVDPLYAALIARSVGAAAWAWISGQTLPPTSRALTQAKRVLDSAGQFRNTTYNCSSHNPTLERNYSMPTPKKSAPSSPQSALADTTEPSSDSAGTGNVPEVHIYQPSGVICATEPRGYPTPQGYNTRELRLDASEGFIPLWAKDVFLKWRFRESVLATRPDGDAIKAKTRDLLGAALVAWGDAAPIKFTEDTDVWDFEIIVKRSDDCDDRGCVLAQAFFPDAGRHQLYVYPKLFTQIPKEQVDTLAHEIGHVFGLRHWFANLSETGSPSVLFGSDNKKSIMNYGADSELTLQDRADLKKLYQLVWSGALTEINGTPIRLVTPYHELSQPSGAIAARLTPAAPSETSGRVGAAQQLLQVASDLLSGKLAG